MCSLFIYLSDVGNFQNTCYFGVFKLLWLQIYFSNIFSHFTTISISKLTLFYKFKRFLCSHSSVFLHRYKIIFATKYLNTLPTELTSLTRKSCSTVNIYTRITSKNTNLHLIVSSWASSISKNHIWKVRNKTPYVYV